MTTHSTATREEWFSARLALLEAEKKLTQQSDEVARRRQALPWVPLDKSYRFDTDAGIATIKDLFRGRSQLLVYHFMFGPDYSAGCPSCSALADGFDGFFVHLENHDVAFTAVSSAPLHKLQAFKRRMGWRFPWVSSFGSEFNADFSVTFNEVDQFEHGIEYNYQREKPLPQLNGPAIASRTTPDGPGMAAAMTRTDIATYTRERPGMSAFALKDGVVHHTYSTFARGLDGLWGMYQWLDRAPMGRNEEGYWLKHRDQYAR